MPGGKMKAEIALLHKNEAVRSGPFKRVPKTGLAVLKAGSQVIPAKKARRILTGAEPKMKMRAIAAKVKATRAKK